MATNITQLPTTQFSGIDFNNIMADITTLVTDNPNYNSNWDDFLSSNAGRMVIELFAYIADQLSIRIDWFANENFISTATQDSSILNLLKLIYYKLSLAYCASVNVSLNLQVPATTTINLTPAYVPGSKAVNIYSVAGTDKNGNSKNFEFLKRNATTGVFDYLSAVTIDGSIASPITSATIEAYEGTTKVTTFTSLTDDNPIFRIPDTSVIQNSVVIYLMGTNSNVTTDSPNAVIEQSPALLEVSNFLLPSASDDTMPIPYVLNVVDVGTVEIEFASASILPESARRFPKGATIVVFYRTGGGVLGNLSVKNINVTKSVLDIAYYAHPIIFTNAVAASGGVDAETIEHARVNGPMVASTSQKTVTVNDYTTILNKYGKILLSKTYGSINAPSDFYSLYHKNISPQEVYNYVLLNKNYIDVPPSKYNNFKWVQTILENRFNELYSFNYGQFNTKTTLVTAGIKPTLAVNPYFGSNTSITFKNAIPFYISSDYTNLIYSGANTEGSINHYLKAKFSTEKISTTYFDMIDVSNDYTSQWLGVPAVRGITTSSSTVSPISTTLTTYYVSIDGTQYPVQFGSAGRGNSSSVTYENAANFINTSLNSTYSGTTSNLNDFMIIGTVSASTEYTITISSNGTPDTFVWQKNGVFSSAIPITTSAISIDNGAFYIKFLSTTGHTIGNMWAVSSTNPAFCTWGINPLTSKYDMNFYVLSSLSTTLALTAGSTSDLIYAIYSMAYPPFSPLLVESAAIDGTGFITGDKTTTGLGWIGAVNGVGGSLVSTDTQNCNAEWVAAVPTIPSSSIGVYGYDISTKKSIGINIDGRGMVTIPLDTDYLTADQKLILLSNPSPLNSSTYISGAQNVGSYKYGIVEKINNYLSINTGYYGSSASSVQWLGLDIVTILSQNSTCSSILGTNATYYIKVNGTDYPVVYGSNGRMSSAYSDLSNYINTALNTSSFSGTAGNLNDLIISGAVTANNSFTVQINSLSITDTYRWKNGASNATTGNWVAASTSAFNTTTNNGTSWTGVAAPISLTGWGANTVSTMVADGSGTLVAVGTNGFISYSTDNGTTWSTPTAISGWSANTINAVATDGLGNWVAVGNNGYFSISKNDGVSWSAAVLVTGWTTNITSIATDGVTWVIGGASGKCSFTTETIMLSGTITWTTTTLTGWSSNSINSIATDGLNNWVAVGGTAMCSTATTATLSGVWSVATVTGFTGNINSIATDGLGNWIAVGASGNRALSINNGTTWVTTTPFTGTMSSIATDGIGNWMVVGASGASYKSINVGSTWGTTGMAGWSTTNLVSICATSCWIKNNVSTTSTLINNAFYMSFANITGHTLGNTWVVINNGPCYCTWTVKKANQNWDLKFYTAIGNTVTIAIAGGSSSDLLAKLYNTSSYSSAPAIPAGNYSAVASVITDSTTGYKYLKLTSPSTGINSTIQFIVSDFSTTLSSSIELMDVFGVSYQSTANTSYPCVGQKKLTLVTNQSSPYYGYVIYEHNSISYPTFYSQYIYSHYIAQQKSSVVLGSVYNNFYETGNAITDATLKNDINLIYNTNVYNNSLPDVERSDIKLAFTSQAVVSNTIEKIQDSEYALDIYPMDYMKIPSMDLHGITSTTFTTNDYLVFSIDSSGVKINISLFGISSFGALYSAIKNALMTTSPYSLVNVANYLELDSSNPYIFWLKSNAKNPTGNITLYRTPVSGGSGYANNHALSAIFGSPLSSASTPISSMQFGTLYFRDGSFNSLSLGLDLATGTRNDAGIMLYHDALVFTYCFIDPKTGLVRYPDYYLSYTNFTKTYAGSSGHDDLTFSGTIAKTYTIKINSLGTLGYPDTFIWTAVEDNVSSSSLNASISGTQVYYGTDSFSISFADIENHALGDAWTITRMNSVSMNKMPTAVAGTTVCYNSTNKIPDNEFYVSFINDRTGESLSTPLDETLLQSYLDDYRLTSVTNVIMQPVFNTFDLSATITYNPLYPLTTIQNSIVKILNTNYGVANSTIGGSIMKSKIVSDIHSINGVVSLSINYFGHDYTDSSTNEINSISTRFDEIVVLSEDIYSGVNQQHGLILTYEQLIQ